MPDGSASYALLLFSGIAPVDTGDGPAMFYDCFSQLNFEKKKKK